jgi:hypothetical protein
VTPWRGGPLLAVAALLLVAPVAPVATAADRDGDGLRDGWERRSGVSDPARRDSDDDGLIDAAEDPDGDMLSNLGEQLFGSHPDRLDSDRDGIPDGAEDDDQDGLTNARQQDRRPLPARLGPSLAKAPTAWPWGRGACQTAHGRSSIRPCKFGDRSADTTVVLFGDSHATQWLPALSMAGKREGWRVVLIAKTGCPSVDVLPRGQVELDEGYSCAAWRDRAVRWIRIHRPAMVIISNLRAYPGEELKASWPGGLQRTLQRLPRRTRAVVLADTPRLRNLPVPCLARNLGNIAACVTDRADALNRDHDRSEQEVATAAGAAFINLSWKVCPYDPCPLIIGRTLLWRDNAHITARFARQLAPAMRRQLLAAVGEGKVRPLPRPRDPVDPDAAPLSMVMPLEPPVPTTIARSARRPDDSIRHDPSQRRTAHRLGGRSRSLPSGGLSVRPLP